MRMTGVIKGSVDAATKAAEERGIGVKVLCVLSDSVTVEFPTPEQWHKLGAWITESPLQAPFPDGTLLITSRHDGDMLPSESKEHIFNTHDACIFCGADLQDTGNCPNR